MSANYVLWINDARTILVRRWDSGKMEVSTRSHPDAIWGPPVVMHSEHPS